MQDKDESFTTRVSQLEELVEQLLIDIPHEEIIQKKMKELDIAYTSDPVERINRVLSALHPSEMNDIDLDD